MKCEPKLVSILARRSLRPVLLASLLLAASVTGLSGCAMISKLTGAEDEAEATKLQELQLKVMRFADEYAGGISEPIIRFQTETQDAAERLAAQNWRLSQTTAAYTIATGPNPMSNALDMVVLATLSRMVIEDSRIQDKYGERAGPLLYAHRNLERGAWALASEVLTEAQLQQLRQVIEEWRLKNPHVDAVAYVYFRDFARAVGRPRPGESQLSGNLFSLIGIDPLSNLDPAVQEIAQTRNLAERTIYYLQRAPRLLDMQVERLTYQIASMPETRDALQDVDRVSLAAEAVGKVAGQLPNLVAREREALIRQLPDLVAREREALISQFMREMAARQHQMLALLALVSELRGALEAGTATFDSLQGTLRGIDSLFGRFDKNEESTAPAIPAKPFDIADYANAAREFAATARQLELLMVQLNAGAPQVGDLAHRTVADMRALVDFAFSRLIILVVVLVAAVWIAALAYRLVVRRIGTRRTQDEEPGGLTGKT
jgi:hypothetical protein